MATKEDILEQVVEEYLIHQGYFVRHNIKFLPDKAHAEFVSKQDSNHSDIDVLGIDPKREGHDRVVAVSCKSWQGGFNPAAELAAIRGDKTLRGRKAWQSFRELTKPKWSEAFRAKIAKETGSSQFTYYTAVARLKGSREAWETAPEFIEAMAGNPVRILTFKEMVDGITPRLTTTVASSELGRLLQMFRAAGMNL